MFCKKCGNEVAAGATFCNKCGAPLRDAARQEGSGASPTSPNGASGGGDSSEPGRKNPSGKKRMFLAAGAAVAVLAAVIGGGRLLKESTKANTETGASTAAESAGAAGEVARETEGANGETEGAVRETEAGTAGGPERGQEPLYRIDDVAAIDFSVQNHTPAAKEPGVTWDSSLFYRLEDIDTENPDDGYLAQCRISKRILRDAADGHLIQYEIYSDPGTGEVYKIVSIEPSGENLRLTDYYYQGGVPNFIFMREDSVYTPTYATPRKTGQRLYFSGDRLAKFRWIDVPDEINEITLTSSDVSYTQFNYFESTEEIRSSYDEAERLLLNAAYNTYEAVTGQAAVGRMEGCVRDTLGQPVAGATVELYRQEDNVLLYRTTAGEDGLFRMFVYLDDSNGYLLVRGSGEFKESALYGVRLSNDNSMLSYGNLVLYKKSGDEYPVSLSTYVAPEVRSNADGSLTRTAIPGVSVTLREGSGSRDGAILTAVQADENGQASFALPSGTYTAQIEAEGYAVSYQEIEVPERETAVESFLLPAVPAGTMAAVLVWDDPAVDLDLTLFTPYRSADGDMAYVGGRIADDGYGNRLVADNTGGCEVVYINTLTPGRFKLFVNDYPDSAAGSYDADTLSRVNARVYLYDSAGFVGLFRFPAGQNGVVWEVMEVSGSQVTPGQRVYRQLEGKSWWVLGKEELRMEENGRLRKALEVLAYSIVDAWGSTEDNVNRLFAGDWERIAQFLLCYNWFYECDAAWEQSELPFYPEEIGNNHISYGEYDTGIALDASQLEWIASSLTGSIWDLDSVYALNSEWYPVISGERAVFSRNVIGDPPQSALENFVTDYIGNNTWRVTADFYLDDGTSGPQRWYSWQMTADIVRNPDSCFDGYSVTGMNFVRTDTQWKQAYYDLVQNLLSQRAIGGDIISIMPFHLDGDAIPELCLENPEEQVRIVATCHDGQCAWFEYSSTYMYDDPSYIPGTGLLLMNSAFLSDEGYTEGATVYQLTGNEFRTLGEGYFNVGYDADGNTEFGSERYVWNGQEVTEEEYNAKRNEIFSWDLAVSVGASGEKWEDLNGFLNAVSR